MLYNLPLLTDNELTELFMKETDRFMVGLRNSVPYNDLNEIHKSLREISNELKRRNKKEQN